MGSLKLKCPNPNCKAVLNLNFKAVPEEPILIKCPNCASKIRFSPKGDSQAVQSTASPEAAAIVLFEFRGEDIKIPLKNGLNSFGRVTNLEGKPVPNFDLNFLGDKHITRGVHFIIEAKATKLGVMEYVLFDEGSKNGTFLNHKDYRLSTEDRELLKNGDIILLGKQKAQFVLTEKPIEPSRKDMPLSAPSNDVTEII